MPLALRSHTGYWRWCQPQASLATPMSSQYEWTMTLVQQCGSLFSKNMIGKMGSIPRVGTPGFHPQISRFIFMIAVRVKMRWLNGITDSTFTETQILKEEIQMILKYMKMTQFIVRAIHIKTALQHNFLPVRLGKSQKLVNVFLWAKIPFPLYLHSMVYIPTSSRECWKYCFHTFHVFPY